MRKLGIDFGDARIGIALSDPMGIIANPLEIYKHVHYNKDVAYIASLVKKYDVDEVVFGLPLNMNGSRGERVVKTEEFANSLKQVANVKTSFVDERLTSVQSQRILNESKKSKEKQKELIDMICASIILQTFLDRKK